MKRHVFSLILFVLMLGAAPVAGAQGLEDLTASERRAYDRAVEKIENAERALPPLFFRGEIRGQVHYFPINGGRYEVALVNGEPLVIYPSVDGFTTGSTRLHVDGTEGNLTAEFLESRSVGRYQYLQRDAELQVEYLRARGWYEFYTAGGS